MAPTLKSRIDAASKKLKKYNQDHILQFINDLTKDQQLDLLTQAEELDLDLIDSLIKNYVLKDTKITLPDRIDPAPVYTAKPAPGLEDKYNKARERGEKLVAAHKVAAFTVAGGMGTRLNFDGPKGNVPATPVRNKILFRVFAEAIAAVQRRFNSVVPWYIMTSPANHEQTVNSFVKNNYFGLTPENVMFFPQGMMPCFDSNGKILLDSTASLSMSPDGHGGSLRALYNSGAIADMARRGVEYISYFQIDNPLVYVIDPLFIGLHALDEADMSSKAVLKCDPLEKVGNFTIVNNRVTVIEYSDLPENLARQTQPNGKLTFEWGSIAIHIINRAFVEKLNEHGFSLPWHRALKKVPYVNSDGQRITPEKTNAVKLETFVFDALPLAPKSIIFEIDRNEQFAPIKNATGVDSIESSHQLQVERAARWMETAGVHVPRKPGGAADALIEISPLFALDSSELKLKQAQLRPIKSGDIIYLG